MQEFCEDAPAHTILMYNVCYVQQLLDIFPMNRKLTGTAEDGNNSLLTQTHGADPGAVSGSVGNSLSTQRVLVCSPGMDQCQVPVPSRSSAQLCKFISGKAPALFCSVLPEWVIHTGH